MTLRIAMTAMTSNSFHDRMKNMTNPTLPPTTPWMTTGWHYLHAKHCVCTLPS